MEYTGNRQTCKTTRSHNYVRMWQRVYPANQITRCHRNAYMFGNAVTVKFKSPKIVIPIVPEAIAALVKLSNRTRTVALRPSVFTTILTFK
eukprot:1615595-Pyramimonas_sp.AAC.1